MFTNIGAVIGNKLISINHAYFMVLFLRIAWAAQILIETHMEENPFVSIGLTGVQESQRKKLWMVT